MLSHPLLHRRELLQVGASSLLDIGLPSLLAGQTVYQALGVDLETEIQDALHRPWRLNAGRPIQALFQSTRAGLHAGPRHPAGGRPAVGPLDWFENTIRQGTNEPLPLCPLPLPGSHAAR